MIRGIIEKIENTKISIFDWIIGFICIVFVRFLLESISSPSPSGMMPTDPYTLIHYGLFFLAVILGLIFITGYFTKNFVGSSKFILFIFPIMWTAPLIDLSLNRGGQAMSYIYALPRELFFNFFKFPFFIPVNGITFGMNVQIAVLFIAIASYVWIKTGSYKNIFFTILSSYIFMFVLGAIPSLLYIISHANNIGITTSQISLYLEDVILKSNIFHNTLHEGAFSVSRFRFFQLGFDKLMSQILFVISFFITIGFFWKSDKQKLSSILKNSRPIRITYYLAPLIIAMGYAVFFDYGTFYSWVDILGVICLLISWFGMWMYSVHINDIYDIEIDKISNTERPLPENIISKEDMIGSSYIFFAIAIIGSWCVGFYSFFFILVGLAVAYIYSAPPLRLRRITLLSSFVISIVILSATLSGFFFISIDKKIHTFPTLLSLGILIFYTLQINFKDIKDIEGDSKQDVKTLPVLFKKNGLKITGICFAISYLLVPFFLNFYAFYVVSIPTSLIGYKLITKKPYNEKTIFLLHFLFLIGLIVVFFISKLLTKI